MRILTTSLLVATLGLTACNSRINPVNWGRGTQSVPTSQTAPEEINPLIPENPRGNILTSLTNPEDVYLGIPIDQVTSVVIESVPGGAIVRATGVADYQGFYDVQLTPANIDVLPEDGVLTFRLEGIYPEEAVRGGPAQLRTVTVGVKLTDNQLAETNVIRVEARLNAQTTTRR